MRNLRHSTLFESLEYLDMQDQIYPILDIDKYQSKIGNDDDLITLTFTVKQEAVADDLIHWLERGYDWVIDADSSPGEVAPDKYLVFAEVNRRSTVPQKIVDMLYDMEPLSGIKSSQWKVRIEEKLYPATAQEIESRIALSPRDYREQEEGELNEWREIAGLKTASIIDKDDSELQQLQRQAGIL